MAAYHYAAYFNTPLDQSPAALASHHPFGISSYTSNLPVTPAKSQTSNSAMSSEKRLASNAMNEQGASPLFRLPAELRVQIYEYLLCLEAPSAKELNQYDHRPRIATTIHPTILSSCRKIYNEAVDLMYIRHIFHAHPSLLASLPHFASPAKPVLYPNMLSKIKRWQLTLRLDTDPRFTEKQATEAFSDAEYCEIRVWQSMYDGCDSSVLRLFLGVRGVTVARVQGCADAELATWLEKRMMRAQESEDEKTCRCGSNNESLICRGCSKMVDVESEWFEKRNAWQFGNR
jgi:hypothetical protein